MTEIIREQAKIQYRNELRERLSSPIPAKTWDEIKEQNPEAQFEETDEGLKVTLKPTADQMPDGYTAVFDQNGRRIYESIHPNHACRWTYDEDGHLIKQEQVEFRRGASIDFSYRTDDDEKILTSTTTQKFSKDASGNRTNQGSPEIIEFEPNPN